MCTVLRIYIGCVYSITDIACVYSITDIACVYSITDRYSMCVQYYRYLTYPLASVICKYRVEAGNRT